MNLKVSIALACYNGQKYIKEQLLSLLNQTRPADEVIIVDDNSNDDTPKIINEFIETHKLINYKYYVNDSNLGYVKNFHKALSKTSGDLIFLCDQDDIWEKSKIEKIYNIYQQHPEISALSTSYQLIDQYSNKISPKHFDGVQNKVLQGIPRNSLVKINHIDTLFGSISPGCTSSFSSYIKDYYVKNASLIAPHDWEIHVYASMIGNLYYYHEPLTLYRMHQNNTVGLGTFLDDEIKNCFDKNCQKNFDVDALFHKIAIFFSKYYPNSSDLKSNKQINQFIKNNI